MNRSEPRSKKHKAHKPPAGGPCRVHGCKKTPQDRWRAVPGGGVCCGGNSCMVALGLKKTPAEYAALRAEKAATISAASPAAADAVAAPEAEPQSATAEPPAAAAEQPAALTAPSSLSDQELLEHTRRTMSYTYDDLREEYEAGREAGMRDRVHEEAERSERTEDLIRWLQSQLGEACSRIEELDVQLEHQEHVHECLQRELPIECAAWDELQGPELLPFDKQQLELWQLMSRESVSDLSVRHRASLARYGK